MKFMIMPKDSSKKILLLKPQLVMLLDPLTPLEMNLGPENTEY